MSKAQAITLQLPVGRAVQGNFYKAYDKNPDGSPRVYPANHQKAGQPKISYFFALAIRKGERHWAETVWGREIWTLGHTEFPQLIDRATGVIPESSDFSWKIEDGDCTKPNPKANGRRNCDREGFASHWIVNLSSTYAPKIYILNAQGKAEELIQPNAVKIGDFFEVGVSVKSNEQQMNPGLYLNHQAVVVRGYGVAIVTAGVDPNAMTWGASALPAGASPTPVGGMMPAAAYTPPGAAPVYAQAPPPVAAQQIAYAPPPGMPAPGGYPPPAAQQPGYPPAAAPVYTQAPPPAAAPTPVVPSQTFLAPPPAPAAPPVVPVMTAKAAGFTYAQMIANNWTDATLRTHGYIV